MEESIARVHSERSSFGDRSPFEVLVPADQSVPLVVASPHSGRQYPNDLMAATRLDALTLRRSEDSFVDELFSGAPEVGAPLIRALFPRAYVDVNREPFELDPRMFEDALPPYVTTRSPRISAGLGTIARIVGSGHEIYARKLRFADALRRIETLYHPYHRSLDELLQKTYERFGCCVLIDAHSMPSAGAGGDWEVGTGRVDFVLGDRHGSSCAPELTAAVEGALVDMGYVVARNEPYPGGFTTRHHGRPREGLHALQIEISRSLYMNEATFERNGSFPLLTRHMTDLLSVVGSLDPAILRR